MSSRRFFSLLGGLGPNSLLAAVKGNKEKIIDDPEEAERAVEKVWG